MPHIEDLYKAELVLLGKVYKADGNTAQEAIANLKVDKAMRRPCLLTVEYRGKTRQKLISSINTMGLFGPSELRRKLAIKNISTLFS